MFHTVGLYSVSNTLVWRELQVKAWAWNTRASCQVVHRWLSQNPESQGPLLFFLEEKWDNLSSMLLRETGFEGFSFLLVKKQQVQWGLCSLKKQRNGTRVRCRQPTLPIVGSTDVPVGSEDPFRSEPEESGIKVCSSTTPSFWFFYRLI